VIIFSAVIFQNSTDGTNKDQSFKCELESISSNVLRAFLYKILAPKITKLCVFGLKFWHQKFCMKNAPVNSWWNWLLEYAFWPSYCNIVISQTLKLRKWKHWICESLIGVNNTKKILDRDCSGFDGIKMTKPVLRVPYLCQNLKPHLQNVKTLLCWYLYQSQIGKLLLCSIFFAFKWLFQFQNIHCCD